MMRRWRVAFGVWLGTGLGAVGALLARQAAAAASPNQLRPLVWLVIAVPLGMLAGAVITQPRAWARAAGWTGMIYVLSIFVAARLERLMIGEAQAAATAHQLYFTLVVVAQIIGGATLGWLLAAPTEGDIQQT